MNKKLLKIEYCVIRIKIISFFRLIFGAATHCLILYLYRRSPLNEPVDLITSAVHRVDCAVEYLRQFIYSASVYLQEKSHMITKRAFKFIKLFVILAISSTPVIAQTSETTRQAIDRINISTVTIVGGDIGSTSLRLAQDIGTVLNDGEKRRALPVLGLDSVQTVSDVLHLRGVDIGLVHEDALDAIGENEVFPNVKDRLLLIARLCNDNIYIVAGSSISDISQLAGNIINFGPGAPSAYTTPALLFQAHGIDVEPVNLNHIDAIEEIKNGRIAATVIIGDDLKSIMGKLRADEGLRLLSIPLPDNSEAYAPVTLTNADFPAVIPTGTTLDTVSVSLVMVVNNWPSSHPRYQKVAQFVEELFSRFEEFQKPTRHPKWQEVNFAAEVPNWIRFQPAEKWVEENQNLREENVAKLENFFNVFLERRDGKKGLTREEWEGMYQQFLSWPNNPIETEVTIRLTNTNGVGEKIGTIKVRNTEILVAGRKEPALVVKPDFAELKPGRYAFHVHENPQCGAAEKDGKKVAGLAAGSPLWLVGTGALEGQTVTSHLGDLPDIVADADGTATKQVVAVRLSLADVVNRAVILHASEDDDSPGLACGVIR
jgi:Cu/Zn superoxide dismutase/TRAP-type uncharacterized transport system substrate-binding protein